VFRRATVGGQRPPVERCDFAVPAPHESGTHEVYRCLTVVSGDDACVVDGLGKGALVRPGACAGDIECTKRAVTGPQEAMACSVCVIVVADDFPKGVDGIGLGSLEIAGASARRVEVTNVPATRALIAASCGADGSLGGMEASFGETGSAWNYEPL
jgi:hypothetical protein